MDLNINIRFLNDEGIGRKLDSIIGLLAVAQHERKHQMATLDQLKADVEAQTTLIQGVSTLISGLRDQVANLPSLSAEQQAEIDSIFATAEANNAALTSALQANVSTPPAPTEQPG